jgi:hypothetical protein
MYFPDSGYTGSRVGNTPDCCRHTIDQAHAMKFTRLDSGPQYVNRPHSSAKGYASKYITCIIYWQFQAQNKGTAPP